MSMIGFSKRSSVIAIDALCESSRSELFEMTITVTPVPLEEVLPLRELYRQEMNCQIVHDSLPERGFGNLFLIRLDGRVAGYGFVMGYRGEPKDMLKELKRISYEMGRIPAARCNASNIGSRATLQKAELFPCARLLSGVVAG